MLYAAVLGSVGVRLAPVTKGRGRMTGDAVLRTLGTAKSGRTTRLACSPSWEAACPIQRLRKSASRHRLDGRGRSESDTAEEADATGILWVADNEARHPVHDRCTGSSGRGRLAVPQHQGQHAMTGLVTAYNVNARSENRPCLRSS